MTAVIRIDVDGTVTRLEGASIDELARAGLAEFGGYHGDTTFGRIDRDEASLDYVTCMPNGVSPRTAEPLLLMAVHEWGRYKGMEVNVKAWGLYGRSPVVGPVFVAHDRGYDGDRPALPEEFLTAIEGPVGNWLPSEVQVRMIQISEEEGVTWPS